MNFGNPLRCVKSLGGYLVGETINHSCFHLILSGFNPRTAVMLAGNVTPSPQDLMSSNMTHLESRQTVVQPALSQPSEHHPTACVAQHLGLIRETLRKSSEL